MPRGPRITRDYLVVERVYFSAPIIFTVTCEHCPYTSDKVMRYPDALQRYEAHWDAKHPDLAAEPTTTGSIVLAEIARREQQRS